MGRVSWLCSSPPGGWALSNHGSSVGCLPLDGIRIVSWRGQDQFWKSQCQNHFCFTCIPNFKGDQWSDFLSPVFEECAGSHLRDWMFENALGREAAVLIRPLWRFACCRWQVLDSDCQLSQRESASPWAFLLCCGFAAVRDRLWPFCWDAWSDYFLCGHRKWKVLCVL